MKRVFLLRHGETDWNRNEVFRGRIDIPLNAMGHLQAAALSEALKTPSFQKVYSSPLSRAYETARGIALSHGLEVVTDEGFIDGDHWKRPHPRFLSFGIAHIYLNEGRSFLCHLQ